MEKNVFESKNKEVKDLVVRREYGKEIWNMKVKIRMAGKQIIKDMVQCIPNDKDGSYKVSANIIIKGSEVWLENVSIKATI